MAIIILLATLFLAYANGANDNFKGVATLFGSRSTDYKKALWWASITTLLGALGSLLVAGSLATAFTGKGLVPDNVVALQQFGAAVALAAAGTVMLATVMGFPISTTHALVGGLVGAGLVAAGPEVHFEVLGRAFVAPLLFSPVVAAGLALVVYVASRAARRGAGLGESNCVALDESDFEPPAPGAERPCDCDPRPPERWRKVLDGAHFLSAGAVCAARGLNDTPKLVALLLAQAILPPWLALVLVAFVMVLGGLLNARKVAETMAERITPMSPGQGFSANLVSALLVTVASRFGLPVSTTHVTCGALFGIGGATGQGDTKVIGSVVASWVLTLPIAGLLAALLYAAGL